MKRRDFLKSSAALATIGAVASNVQAADDAKTTPEYYALRRYHLQMGPKQGLFDDYLRHALVPALNRAGISPVGVFNVMIGPDSPTVHVLLPVASFEALAAADAKVLADEEYKKAGADFMGAAATDPTFIRLETTFLRAFATIPKLEVPAGAATGKSRIFELRTYESPTEAAGRKKVEMFNQGEIAIFRRVGLNPVFFGEALAGPRLPHLTYMLAFADVAERTKNWSAFGGDPDWQRLSHLPEYANLVSNISNALLQPTGYSQI